MNYQKNYYPRRPVKSFQDLEVYQKLLAVSVAVVKRSAADLARPLESQSRKDKLVKLLLALPLWIAEAHSIRFSAPQAAIDKLEQTMLGCNQAVVYLEQYRDIENKDIELPAAEIAGSLESRSQGPQGTAPTIEPEFFDEQIKNLLTTRTKVLHLQMSWKKFAKGSDLGRGERSDPLALRGKNV